MEEEKYELDSTDEETGRELRELNLSDVEADTSELADSDKELVLDYFKRTRFHPIHNLILVCKRDACRYSHKCPFYKVGHLPEYGEDCWVEQTLIKIWTEQLISELNIKDTDIVDQAQVREMVALGVFENRAYMGHLADEPMVEEVIKNVAFDGTSITELTIHPLMKQLLENQKLKDKIRSELISTREAKAKMNVVKEDGLMAKFAEMMKKKKEKSDKELGHNRELPEGG